MLSSSVSNAPLNGELWKEHWTLIEKMRKSVPATFDTTVAELPAQRGLSDANDYRFKTLVSVMLSPQTKDDKTFQALENLVQLVHPEPFVPSALAKCSVADIEKACRPVSFYTVKAKNILDASIRCRDNHNNDIPENIDDLFDFKGVGPKVGYLTFFIAWGILAGICVDTHVHRTVNRLGWVDTWHSKSNGPEVTRRHLEAFLPREKWGEVNWLLVGFGQTICGAVSPKCNQCLLKDTCKFNLDEEIRLKMNTKSRVNKKT